MPFRVQSARTNVYKENDESVKIKDLYISKLVNDSKKETSSIASCSPNWNKIYKLGIEMKFKIFMFIIKFCIRIKNIYICNVTVYLKMFKLTYYKNITRDIVERVY